MEPKHNQPTSVSKIERQLLTRESASLGIILHSKNPISLKKTAAILAPGGNPNFGILLSKQTTQLSQWKREYGEDKITEIIFFLIEDLNNYFNVSRPMTTSQMASLSIEFTQELWWARMEEIVAFFEAVKKQRYGKVYERLDPAYIWEMWEKYNEERTEHCTQHESRFKQYDPRPDTGSGVGLNGLAGAIGDVKAQAKRLREIKNKGNSK